MTTDNKVIEFNCETGKEVIRDMNAVELAQRAKDEAENLINKAKQDEILAKRQAILDKLGLTADEVSLIIQ
jgi:hypothetical protein